MGNSIVFDTHSYVKKLQSAGFSEEQAEILSSTQADLIEGRLATKQDIATLKHDIKEMEAALKRDIKVLETTTKRDIKELEASTKRDLKEMEMRLTIRLGTITTTGVVVVAALVKLL